MIYLISDLHLDHKNIMRYCDRPFSSVEEMNRTIIDNWNEVVEEDDFVYLVGDLAFGRRRSKMRYWLKKLNGNVILILEIRHFLIFSGRVKNTHNAHTYNTNTPYLHPKQ